MDLEHGILLLALGMVLTILVFILLLKFEKHVEDAKKKPPLKKEWWH
mgnify:CR=1 FL=1